MVTVKVAVAVTPLRLPVTVTVKGPAVAATFTWNEEVDWRTPFEIIHDCRVTHVPVIEQDVSPLLNCPPFWLIFTTWPGGPRTGFSVIFGVVSTLIVDVTLSRSSVVTMIVYVPGATPAPITKDPVPALMDPPAMVQSVTEVTRPTVVEVTDVQAVAAAPKPEPVIATVVPVGPSIGVRVIEGTENDWKALSPEGLPVTVI